MRSLKFLLTRSDQCLGIVAALNTLFQRGAAVIALQFFLMIWQPVHAQGATGPPGLEGLVGMLILLTVYPYIGIGLSFLLFKATGRAIVFYAAPVVMVGLSILAPVDPTGPPPQSPEFFSLPGLWVYWPHILAIALVHWVYSRKNRGWLFFLAPVVGWIIQFISLLILLVLR